jgi:anti-sigma regulatory factor (Ser/Thr protein kinase)
MGNEIPVTDLAYARDVVRASLLDQPPDTVEIATLLTDELLANALEHGVGTPVLALEVNPYQLRVYVHDEDPTRDLAPLPIEPTRERGRGLAIVAALAAQWGVEPRRDGKRVWFALALSSADGAGRPKL